MDRKAYNQCISNGFKTYKKELEEYPQPFKFCSIAKLCANRAKDLKEAIAVCSQPREPKPEEATDFVILKNINGRKVKIDVAQLDRICVLRLKGIK